MLILVTALKHLFDPYWDTLKKDLAKENVAPLTIAQSPNLLGHPIGIIVLIVSGIFVIPREITFFEFWLGMIAISSCAYILTIRALIETKFFAVQVLGSLVFVTSSIFAVIILGEKLHHFQVIAIILATIGVSLFSWPKIKDSLFIVDKGVIYILIAVTIGGLTSVLYKIATLHAQSYSSFLTGRFIGDLIGWNIVWLISLVVIKRNPLRELGNVYGNTHGLRMVVGVATSTLLSSWLIYKLPVTTMAILSTLTFPASYFLSQLKYREKITLKMWLGTFCILGALLLFFLT